LRRVIVTRERVSFSLTARYDALDQSLLTKALSPPVEVNSAAPSKGKYANSPPRLPPPIGFAAAQNLSREFFAVLDGLGLEVVIVQFQAGKESPLWKHPKFEEDLDAELRAVRAGAYDSSAYGEGSFLHFFHVSNLGKAMQTLKASIEARGLLPITTILHGESHDSLRIYYPPQEAENQVVSV
jgi:hypothetical protein